MAAYILFGIEAKHLLTAVIMTAPGTIMMAKMLVPETEMPEDDGDGQARDRADRRQRDRRRRPRHRRGAAARPERRRHADLVPRADRAGQRAARASARPRACSRSSAGCSRRSPGRWACRGATRRRSATCSARGWRSTSSSPTRKLGPLKATLDPKSFTIATFALCGFANFSSIGIQIGGIGALAPNRRHDLARLGLRAMFAGTLANFMTATIAGFLL